MELFEKQTPPNNKKDVENSLAKRLESRASRRFLSRRDGQDIDPRMGLSFLGAIVWHVPVPTVLGALVGKWLDGKYPHGTVSWSLNLMLLGLALGMLSTWIWVRREGIERALRDQKEREASIEALREQAHKEVAEQAARVEDGNLGDGKGENK